MRNIYTIIIYYIYIYIYQLRRRIFATFTYLSQLFPLFQTQITVRTRFVADLGYSLCKSHNLYPKSTTNLIFRFTTADGAVGRNSLRVPRKR